MNPEFWFLANLQMPRHVGEAGRVQLVRDGDGLSGAVALLTENGIQPATFRFSGGGALALELFALARLDARPAIRRVGSARLTRWPHLGPAK